MEETFFEPEEWVSMCKLDALSRAEVLIAYIVKPSNYYVQAKTFAFLSQSTVFPDWNTGGYAKTG